MRAEGCPEIGNPRGTMTETIDDEDFTPEKIASELKAMADVIRRHPIDPAELQKLTERVELIAELILQRPAMDPALALRLQDLAEQLRTGPEKRKNGSSP